MWVMVKKCKIEPFRAKQKYINILTKLLKNVNINNNKKNGKSKLSMDNFFETIKNNFRIGEPIFTNEILELFNLSKQRVMLLLKQSIDKGEIKKEDRGIYYIPKFEQIIINGVDLGISTDNSPTFEDIINKKYKFNLRTGEIYGINDGMVLENRLHLTTQVPSVFLIVTNKIGDKYKTDYISGVEVKLKKSYTKITKDNYREYEVLQVINVINDPQITKWKMERLKKDIKEENKNVNVIKSLMPYFPERVTEIVKRYKVIE